MKLGNRKIKKSFYFFLLSLTMLVFIAFVERRGMERNVHKLEIFIQGMPDVHFVDEEAIARQLENEFPVLKPGSSLQGISLNSIEKKVEKHPFVKQAEVFKDLKGRVVVKIEQHRPVARIIRPRAAHGYISAGGEILPTSRNYTSRVLTLQGPMAEELLSLENLSGDHRDLLELILFIDGDEFWRAQIAGLEVDRNKNIKMYQQVGQQVIEFGKPVEIKEKFEKIDLFYSEILPVKGWDAYKRVNVKYNGQIICE